MGQQLISWQIQRAMINVEEKGMKEMESKKKKI